MTLLPLICFLLSILPNPSSCSEPVQVQRTGNPGIIIDVRQYQYPNGSTVSTAKVKDATTTQRPQGPKPSVTPDFLFSIGFTTDGGPSSFADIKNMLQVILKKSRFVYTPSMGVTNSNYDGTWSRGGGDSLISTAAAQINKASQTTRLKVSQGVRLFDANDLQPDLDNAFISAQSANQMWPGTVWGICLNANNMWNSIQNVEEMSNMLTALSRYNIQLRTHSLGLRVGTKLDICSEIVDGRNKEILSELAKELDFVVCFVYPPLNTHNPKDGVASISRVHGNYRKAFAEVNPKLEVVIETAWPSEGNSDFNTDAANSISKQREFWRLMENWSRENNVRVCMHEAFDQPAAQSEMYRHYGFWQRSRDNKGVMFYVEKSASKRIIH